MSERVKSKNRFVIQKHYATQVHFDFRLEMDGVLKSWAVPKGVPHGKNTKRLAIKVEDHPLEFLEFEGTIPDGEYGAGQITIWDKGTYKVVKRTEKSIELILKGEKIIGSYLLVHWRNRDWLLMKLEDSRP